MTRRIHQPDPAGGHRSAIGFSAALFCVLPFLGFSFEAQALKLGVMGDSLSDEYGEESYGSYAENWVEQLEIHAGIDLGPTASMAGQPGGSWGEPRRTLYEFNWARSGADSITLLSGGQHTGVASAVASDAVDFGVLFIGANDFFPSGAAYLGIYLGTWNQGQIDAHVAGVLSRINTALDEMESAGLPMVLFNVPDYGIAPAVAAALPDAAGRQLVTDVIDGLNASLDAEAEARGLVIVDIGAALVSIFGTHTSPSTSLLVGNIAIDLTAADTASGTIPTAGFVDDGVHPNTVLQGILANSVLEALNVGFGTGIALFTEAEILDHRGIAYGGSDTLSATYGDYADYITAYPPPPPSVPSLDGMSLIVLCALLSGLAIRRARP
jgi:lysophospholipase L1-like esterase